MPIAPSSWSGPSAAIVAAMDALADQRDVARPPPNDAPWLSTIIGTCSAAALTPNGMVGVVDEQMMFGFADEAEQVRHVAAAAPLDVVGVDRPAGDRGDRVLELGRLVQPVRVQRDGDVVRVGEPQDVVDQLRVGAVVLVDLEAARARIEQGLERSVVLRPGAGLQPDVDRPLREAGERPLHRPRRLLEAGGDERRHAAGQRPRAGAPG